jgi:pyruvate/2-oxoglutarate dehydrogenase complex dihydrolipoamide acyltransferase (E2) component
MLQSFETKSPIAGTIVSILSQGSKISAGALLARIRDPSNAVQEFRSPLDGSIDTVSVKEGETVGVGQTIAWLLPDRATINGAIQALAYVGTRDDLPLLETFSQGTASSDPEIKQQAALTAKAISSRSPSEK